jgi:hypothetical protein
MHYLLRGGFVPTWFSLFPLFFIQCSLFSFASPWLWKKMNIKEKRRSTNCAESTLTENGLNWSKKQKRRSEVGESDLLNEKIKEDRSERKMDRGQLTKRKNPSTYAWSTLWERRKDRLVKP